MQSGTRSSSASGSRPSRWLAASSRRSPRSTVPTVPSGPATPGSALAALTDFLTVRITETGAQPDALYDDSGWTRLAGEKLDLLDRLVALDADPALAVQVSAARAARAARA